MKEIKATSEIIAIIILNYKLTISRLFNLNVENLASV